MTKQHQVNFRISDESDSIVTDKTNSEKEMSEKANYQPKDSGPLSTFNVNDFNSDLLFNEAQRQASLSTQNVLKHVRQFSVQDQSPSEGNIDQLANTNTTQEQKNTSKERIDERRASIMSFQPTNLVEKPSHAQRFKNE